VVNSLIRKEIVKRECKRSQQVKVYPFTVLSPIHGRPKVISGFYKEYNGYRKKITDDTKWAIASGV
jgi:hypothetical protein